MDDPNMTMEEYIMLEEKKARRHGQVFNRKTATYGNIRVDDDFRDLRFVETKFPAIVMDITFASQDALPCESNLKTDSKNDNEEVNIPLFLSPMPTTSFVDDLDFFKDFKNEFPAIVYNDTQMSKSDLLTEPILSPQHIDEFNLNDETSMSKYDKEEQNVLYFNDLFPFNIIHFDNLKSKKDNDENEIDIVQSSGDMALPPHDQRHQYLRYKGLQYTDADILDFKSRLTRIHMREDLILSLSDRLIAYSIAGRSQATEKFVARLAKHFGLLTIEILHGLMVIAPELLIIDIAELVRLQIYIEIDDTWAWVALGPKSTSVATTTTTASATTMSQRMARLEEDVYEIRRALAEQR
uniref:Uncharacterized protein n=1 Tax=Tanacetum cinerariifolium TaxID=118510 RepID=A0A6L2NMF3_TANCI|nr:hypothetical protein [Tanacetum cinerariifolium]